MRLIQANCTIRYSGRCETFLPEAVRLIVVKDDRSVMVHVDSGIKPLNYMKGSKDICFIRQDGHDVLYAANKKEELYVDMLEVLADIRLDFEDSEREMVKIGTEEHLQQYIFEHFSEIVPGHEGVCREFETGKGPVDVFGYSEDEQEVSLVEVKRHAHRKDVYQVLKYSDGIDNLVSKAEEKGFDAWEAKQKGDSDGIGTLIPVEAFKNKSLYLASLNFARGTIEEAEEHGVGILDLHEDYEASLPDGLEGTQGRNGEEDLLGMLDVNS